MHIIDKHKTCHNYNCNKLMNELQNMQSKPYTVCAVKLSSLLENT